MIEDNVVFRLRQDSIFCICVILYSYLYLCLYLYLMIEENSVFRQRQAGGRITENMLCAGNEEQGSDTCQVGMRKRKMP